MAAGSRKQVVNKTASRAKTVAVVTGSVTSAAGAAIDGVREVAPALAAMPLVKLVLQLPWWMLAAGAIAAFISTGIWLAARHK